LDHQPTVPFGAPGLLSALGRVEDGILDAERVDHVEAFGALEHDLVACHGVLVLKRPAAGDTRVVALLFLESLYIGVLVEHRRAFALLFPWREHLLHVIVILSHHRWSHHLNAAA